ncbi:MAG TPA: indole-3-glycerol phosphate synthase TrpC, partial [Cyclobacteriaceae bacterium]|nr:indole-3-glycerol phosphate synthase TrpC [Cyclobacteriaceae bacterium]
MDILEQIIAHKKKEVADRKALYPVALLEQSIYYKSNPVSLKKYLLRDDKSGIIAEIKRKSPSKGMINPYVSVERTSIGYMQAGASALSVLTDKEFFGGTNDDLRTARKFNFCPILRKDFIIDEYQIIEAKSIGADAILLIAAVLAADELKRFHEFARSLMLEVLVEVHDELELNKVIALPLEMIGVNSRNLKTFETNIQSAINLAGKIPQGVVKVAESGIDHTDTILELKQHGYNGFLMGEHFMRNARPEQACREFIRE